MTMQIQLKNLPILDQLAAELDDYFTQSAKASEHLAQWLAQRCNLRDIQQLLLQLLANPEQLGQISQRSYQHGNGFLKVVLLDRGYKLRLHIWFAGQSCEENIHDHRWSFASHILCGTLYSEIWRDARIDVCPAVLADEYQYHAARGNQAAFKTYKGVSQLTCETSLAYSAGQSYVMPEQRLHRIINPGQQLVATIMCTAPTGQGTTRLIPTQNGIDPNIQPPRLNVWQLKTQLNQFLGLIGQESSTCAA